MWGCVGTVPHHFTTFLRAIAMSPKLSNVELWGWLHCDCRSAIRQPCFASVIWGVHFFVPPENSISGLKIDVISQGRKIDIVTWWCLIIFDDIWWFLMILDDIRAITCLNILKEINAARTFRIHLWWGYDSCIWRCIRSLVHRRSCGFSPDWSCQGRWAVLSSYCQHSLASLVMSVKIVQGG
jgi:hypothetical protein